MGEPWFLGISTRRADAISFLSRVIGGAIESPSTMRAWEGGVGVIR